MVEYILLAAMAAVVILLLLLRTNTAIGFLALCAGSVLVDSSGANMGLIAVSLTSGISSTTNIARIALLFGPLFAVAILLRNHLQNSKLPLAFIPAAATALLGVIFVVPELSDGLEATIVETNTWQALTLNQEVIVVFGLVSSILLLVLSLKKPESKHKKGRH